ncbi:MAG: ABC transporter substrate-binding protein [Synergistaceae bacterium]|nr:ABC transporter substrate-binding protein [Synergistaceae bacterium]
MKKVGFLITLSVIIVTAGLLYVWHGASDTQRVSSAKTERAETFTVVDHLGNKVEVPKKIERVAVAAIYPFPSVLTVFLGSAKKIVGMSPFSMTAAKAGLLGEIFPEILNAKTDFTSGTDLNIEELLKLKPDVVFYYAGNAEWTKMLKNAGIPGIAVASNEWNCDVMRTYDEWISLLSKVFPEDDKAKQVSEYSKKVYNDIQKKVVNIKGSEKKKILFLFQYDDQKIITSGRTFFGQSWCDAVGGKNVAEEIEVYNAKITMEQVYAWNPDVIFITNFTPAMPDDLYDNKIAGHNWSNVNAVKNKAVYKMPLGSYRSFTPGADTPVTMMWMAQKVYPKLFADINIEKEVKDYYGKLYGVKLTDKQIKRMYNQNSGSAQGFKQ